VTFRRKLVTVFALTVVVSVAAVSGLVLLLTRNAYEKAEAQRTTALVEQFQREFNRRGDDVVRRVEQIAGSEAVMKMASALNGTSADSAEYFELSRTLAESRQLDFLEILDAHGVIVSSAQWPSKFGYPETNFARLVGARGEGAFLKIEELQDGSALGLFAVRTVSIEDRALYVVGGRHMDKNFLAALDLPPNMRALLYENRGDHFSTEFLLDPGASSVRYAAEKFAPLVNSVRQYGTEMMGVVAWSPDRTDEEVFHAIPLRGLGGDRPLLAILLIGNSRRSYIELKRHIRDSALLVSGGGIFVAILLSSWAAARVTRPVEQLASAARDVTSGRWDTRVEVRGHDEVAQLAESFNRMTSELLAQKERLVQTERVAAWRELARRLAHELKNPLFPLQLTVENLIRARTQYPEQFDEVFRESSQTLLAEISNLNAIIGRFSEFSKMPQPHLQRIQVNDIVSGVAQLFQAQLQAAGRAPIACTLQLDSSLEPIAADPDLLHRALSNLVLNAMDAMPNGGEMALSTRSQPDTIVIEVADTGCGLTREECERIFTPYYTSKQHGTGLGLAIVQSVISDHGGRIRVESEPERGATFVIELPRRLDLTEPATIPASANVQLTH
jgi:signal transduction histidine kinase